MPKQTDAALENSVPSTNTRPMVLNELEARVAKIWADSLEHMEKIGPNDSFFDLGGDSLSMMIVLFQIGEQLGIELTQAELLQAHTLRQFCAVIEAARTDLPARGQS